MTLLHLLIVGWLPGAAIFRLPFGDRDARAALEAEERLFWAVIISAALSMSVVLALASVGRYTFDRLLIADLAITAVAAAAGRFRLGYRGTAKRLTPGAILPLALILLGVWRFFPPSEYIIGGKDPGTYINEGVQIAQRGTFVYRDPVVAEVPPFARDLFFPSHLRHDYYSLRFMGFRVNDPESGAVVGQFPHVFPAAIAIGYGLDGLTGARRTVGVWAILGVLAVYFAGQRLFGRTAAFTAAALLALHVIEVWFARYPNAEVVMQALLFAALLAHARAHVDGNRFFAPIAGVLLGLLLFLRFDAVLGIAAVLGAVALLVLARRLRPDPWFFAGLGVTVAAGTVYLLGPMRAYVDLPIVFLSHLHWWQYGVMAGTVVLAIAALAAGARAPAVGAWVSTWTPALLTAALVAAAAYSYWLRAPIDGVLAARDAYSLRTFTAFYLTLPGLLAAVLGFALFAHRVFWRAPELFATVAVYAFFFFYKVRIFSDHFWMARRFLPVILPGALLFAAAAALGGSRGTWAPTRLVRQAIGVAFVAVLAMQFSRAAAPVLAHVEYAGIIPRLETLAKQVGDRDLLIVESRNASDSHVLAVPLAYIYDRHVLMLNSPRPDKAALAAYLEWARTRYDRVLFLGGGGTDLLSPSWSARPVASERFAVPEYDAPVDAYPRFARSKEFDYSLYALLPPDPADAARPFDLDVGVSDDLHVLRFHAKESSEGRSFRWSRDRSLIAVTGLTAASREVVLSLNDGGRPAAAPPAELAISLAGEPLGSVRVTTGFKDYVLAIPPALAARLAAAGGTAEMRLTTSVWKPEAVIGGGDDRDLGVMVDRVTVR